MERVRGESTNTTSRSKAHEAYWAARERQARMVAETEQALIRGLEQEDVCTQVTRARN
jgi:hypothetical protein